MSRCIRQNWDFVNDQPKHGKWLSIINEERLRQQAESVPVPEFRAKLVKLPHGQTEVSITPVNRKHVMDLRCGFNPLLDLPRNPIRTGEEQQRRDDENRGRAAKRAKQNVRHLVKCIFADHMLTFSYRENVLDRAQVAKDWKEFVRLFRLRYPQWKYLAVLEKQERGSFHMHVAVSGKQDIKWLLRCWLLAIGQPLEDVNLWLCEGVKLGEKSKGAVNVEPPKARWGGAGKWRRDKLSGYLTKYIGKEFEEADKGAKKYWACRNVERPEIKRFWLRAKTYIEAIREAHDLIYYTGADTLSMWGDYSAGVVWITGETDRKNIGQCSEISPDEIDFLED